MCMPLYTSALSFILNVSFALSDVLTPNDVPEFVYYMNDGVYGSFMGKLFGKVIATPSVHKVNKHTCTRTHEQYLYQLPEVFKLDVLCFSDVAHPRWACVLQQLVGSIMWPTGPGGGALLAPWARCWGLAHFQQHGGERSGGSSNPQRHRPTTCVLHHLHRWLVIMITFHLTFCASRRLFLSFPFFLPILRSDF